MWELWNQDKVLWNPTGTPDLRRAILSRQAHAQVAGLTIMVPNTDLETAPSLCRLGYSFIQSLSCHQHHLPKDSKGVTPVYSLNNRPISINSDCGPWNRMWSGSSLVQSRFWKNCPLRDLLENTPVTDPEGRPVKLYPIIDPQPAL